MSSRNVNAAWFDRTYQACGLRPDWVARANREDLALTVIHELCHARLEVLGVQYDAPLRLRIEQICLRRELAFARRLMSHRIGTRDHVMETERRLAHLTPEQYADARFDADRRKDRLEALVRLKRLGAPRCLRAPLIKRLRRQRAQARDANAPKRPLGRAP